MNYRSMLHTFVVAAKGIAGSYLTGRVTTPEAFNFWRAIGSIPYSDADGNPNKFEPRYNRQ